MLMTAQISQMSRLVTIDLLGGVTVSESCTQWHQTLTYRYFDFRSFFIYHMIFRHKNK